MHDFGLRRVHRFDSNPVHTRLDRQRFDQSQGIHAIRHIVGQAMAVSPNAAIDAPSPHSSNAAKTPTSSRMYISSISSSFLHLFLPSIIIPLGRATATFSNPSIIDLFTTDRLPTVSASDAFRNLSDDHQSPSNAYTDISEVDNALGGGFECGRVTELWGPPGAGKTAIAYVECHVREHMFWV